MLNLLLNIKIAAYIICFLIVLIAKFAIRKYSAHDKRQAKIYLIGIQLPPKGFPPGGRGSGCGLRRTLYVVLPYKPNISLIHSILYNKLFAYIYKFLYLYIIILADIYA